MYIIGGCEVKVGPWGYEEESNELLRILRSKPIIKETPYMKYKHCKQNTKEEAPVQPRLIRKKPIKTAQSNKKSLSSVIVPVFRSSLKDFKVKHGLVHSKGKQTIRKQNPEQKIAHFEPMVKDLQKQLDTIRSRSHSHSNNQAHRSQIINPSAFKSAFFNNRSLKKPYRYTKIPLDRNLSMCDYNFIRRRSNLSTTIY